MECENGFNVLSTLPVEGVDCVIGKGSVLVDAAGTAAATAADSATGEGEGKGKGEVDLEG